VLGYFAVCDDWDCGAHIVHWCGRSCGDRLRGRSWYELIVGGLLIVLGLRTLLLNTPDRVGSAAKWREAVRCITPAKVFGIGMALFPIQIKNLAIFIACMNLISTANLSPGVSIVALVVVLMVFAVPVLVLIGLYATVPQRASNTVGSLRVWMQNNNRTITVVLCLVFGAFFLVRGLWGS
jgi:Sap, sulfolipid-1-addressing protein